MKRYQNQHVSMVASNSGLEISDSNLEYPRLSRRFDSPVLRTYPKKKTIFFYSPKLSHVIWRGLITDG